MKNRRQLFLYKKYLKLAFFSLSKTTDKYILLIILFFGKKKEKYNNGYLNKQAQENWLIKLNIVRWNLLKISNFINNTHVTSDFTSELLEYSTHGTFSIYSQTTTKVPLRISK